MTLKAPRSKPQMLSKPLSSVSAMACPVEVSPHITILELAPVFCLEKKKRFGVKYERKAFVCIPAFLHLLIINYEAIQFQFKVISGTYPKKKSV